MLLPTERTATWNRINIPCGLRLGQRCGLGAASTLRGVRYWHQHDMRAGGKAISKSRGRVVETAAPKWKLHFLLVGAVICAALSAYSNSFRAPFLLDNDPMILQDNRIRSVTSEHIHRIVTQQYWATHITRLYRPVTTFSYLFNY